MVVEFVVLLVVGVGVGVEEGSTTAQLPIAALPPVI